VNGLIPVTTFVEYSGLELDHLTAWQHVGLLPAATTDHRFPASALIAAVLTDAAAGAVGRTP